MRLITMLVLAGCFAISASGQYYPDKPLKKWLKSGSYKWVGDSTKDVGGFWIAQGELENFSWMEYLYVLKRTDTNLYNAALPDTTVWRNKLAYNEPYVEYYLRHPAYRRYPVVGVTKKQVEDYCTHMSKYLDTAFGGTMSPNYIIKFRLPTESEWETAARGGTATNSFGFDGNSIQRTDKKHKGEYCANHLRFSQGGIEILPDSTLKLHSLGGYRAYMGIAGHLNDNADVTAPVVSYWPNAFGLYNMSGNVSEMVADKDVVKGGSWRNPPYYLQVDVHQEWNPNKGNQSVGARIIVEFEKK